MVQEHKINVNLALTLSLIFVNLHTFLSSDIFSKSIFLINSFRNTIRVSKGLDPDQSGSKLFPKVISRQREKNCFSERSLNFKLSDLQPQPRLQPLAPISKMDKNKAEGIYTTVELLFLSIFSQHTYQFPGYSSIHCYLLITVLQTI